MIQLRFQEIRVTALAPTPVLILREAEGPRTLAVRVSAAGAAAVLSGHEAESVDHPSTHELLVEALAAQGATIESVEILRATDGVFEAQMSMGFARVRCRVSDGVALAGRSGARILVSESLIAEYGIWRLMGAEVPGDAEVEQFREFLANVRADDFDDPGL